MPASESSNFLYARRPLVPWRKRCRKQVRWLRGRGRAQEEGAVCCARRPRSVESNARAAKAHIVNCTTAGAVARAPPVCPCTVLPPVTHSLPVLVCLWSRRPAHSRAQQFQQPLPCGCQARTRHRVRDLPMFRQRPARAVGGDRGCYCAGTPVRGHPARVGWRWPGRVRRNVLVNRASGGLPSGLPCVQLCPRVSGRPTLSVRPNSFVGISPHV